MRPGPVADRHLAIDAIAAGSAGGYSRLRELTSGLPSVQPKLKATFVVTRVAARSLRLDAKDLYLSPRWSERLPLRLLWEHQLLPTELAKRGVTHLLSPFNVLPLGHWPGQKPTTAVIVSNIGPFAQEIYGPSRGYQRARLSILRHLTVRSLRRADRVFLLSRLAQGLLSDYVDPQRVTLLPMAAPQPQILLANLSLPLPAADHPYFLSVGDLLPYKGTEDVIRAMAILRAESPEVKLIICGRPVDRGYEVHLRRLKCQLELESVRFVGRLDHSLILELMAGSVGVVVTSRVENPNRVPVEAMRMGAPLIAVDVPISREVCEGDALYYPVGEPAELARQMKHFLADQALRESLAANGRRRVSQLDWLSATRTILQTLELA